MTRIIMASCILCQRTFSRISCLIRHYKFVHDYDDSHIFKEEVSFDSDSFACPRCEVCFENQDLLIKHSLGAHISDSQYKCQACGQIYCRSDDLKHHRLQLCPVIFGDKISCAICQHKYTPARLRAHLAFVHNCRFCEVISQTRGDKMRHLSAVHADTMLMTKCIECDKTYETEKCLRMHQSSCHGMEFIVCPKEKCRLLFPKGSQRLRSHLRNFHSQKNELIRATYKFECNFCGKKLKSSRILQNHLLLKHPGRNVAHFETCPFCNYTVPRKRKGDIYRYHIRRRHPEQVMILSKLDSDWERIKLDRTMRAKIQCHLCSFAGCSLSGMPRHYEDIHGYVPSMAENNLTDEDCPDGALCPQCGQHFTTKHRLIKHLLKIHSQSSGEHCLYCNHRYIALEDHISLMHQVEKAADAQYCKKCIPHQKLSSFHDLLSHSRAYHHRQASSDAASSRGGGSSIHKQTATERITGVKPEKESKLCENCGKTVAALFMNRHLRTECTANARLLAEADVNTPRQRYVPVHLAGTCPYCQFKFSDLLGHIRHGHREAKAPADPTLCVLCGESFASVRQLVSHRQNHPTFNSHKCLSCRAEFVSVVELRTHRRLDCRRRNNRGKKSEIKNQGTAVSRSILDTSSVMIDASSRGTVKCFLCLKEFTMKALLRRHFVSYHDYNAQYDEDSDTQQKDADQFCHLCTPICSFSSIHSLIKHNLAVHATVSGQICPYCDHNQVGARKFNNLDEHVSLHHPLEMQSPFQTCLTCKTNFGNYETLKEHRQLHDGGRVALSATVELHSRLKALPEIENRGGIKCCLCAVFTLRKNHIKLHYMKHHGYNPKAISSTQGEQSTSIDCPVCLIMFEDNNDLIRHLLRCHCAYSGLICPFCPGHFPKRFIDLQLHVTSKHIDRLVSYDVQNVCKVCHKQFTGYALFRDHVQIHGDGYRDAVKNRATKTVVDITNTIDQDIVTACESDIIFTNDNDFEENHF